MALHGLKMKNKIQQVLSQRNYMPVFTSNSVKMLKIIYLGSYIVELSCNSY